jgi:hypothetical protein
MQVQQRVSLVCMYHPRGNLYAAEIDCVKSMHDGKEYLLVYTGWCVEVYSEGRCNALTAQEAPHVLKVSYLKYRATWCQS